MKLTTKLLKRIIKEEYSEMIRQENEQSSAMFPEEIVQSSYEKYLASKEEVESFEAAIDFVGIYGEYYKDPTGIATVDESHLKDPGQNQADAYREAVSKL